MLAGCLGDERDFIRVACLNSLVAAIEAEASYVGNNPANNATVMGTASDPKIVIVNGDYNLNPPGSSAFGGILVVKGTFSTTGNASYTGLVLAIGEGVVDRSGGGNGSICGGVLAADVLNDGDDGFDSFIPIGYAGQPSYSHNGGGNSLSGVCDDALVGDLQQWALPLARVAFQQLR